MKNSFKIAVLLLVLALIIAAGCARPGTGEDALEPGEENGGEVIGADNGGDGEEIGNDNGKEDAGKDSGSNGGGETGNGSGDSVAEDPEGELMQDSGTYLGQVDPHSIEIHISGVPLAMDPQVFQLSGKVMKEFESYGFETGDQVKFSYIMGDHGGITTMTIIEIDKIKN
ncbi:MAG: hypothetical protein GX878_02325 [Firmicutes bacterium]|nr:hypothetical protein [Bacillota bacterium]